MSDGKRVDDIQGQILHVYDGIEEADNSLPLWWLITLWGSIVFSIFYWFYYHELSHGGLSPMEAYNAEMEAQAGDVMSEELLLTMVSNPAALAEGAELFKTNCVSCHGDKAHGIDAAGKPGIGPNLTDEFWIHGGSTMQIHDTISKGATGESVMPPWGDSLGSKGVGKVAAYVLSLRNTNVKGKDPQGDKYDPNAEAAPAEAGAEAAPAEAKADAPTEAAPEAKAEEAPAEPKADEAAPEAKADAPADAK